MSLNPISIHIQSKASAALTRKREIADQIVSNFRQRLPNLLLPSVLCLIDDQDFADLKTEVGVANRGLFFPMDGGGLSGMIPEYLWDLVSQYDYSSDEFKYLFDSVIYIHGSTSDADLGLGLTLAHELQHYLQYALERPTWAVNALFPKLPPPLNESFKAWADIPIERDARITAKGIAEKLFGAEAVRAYIQDRIADRLTESDAEDWQFMLNLDTSCPYGVAQATARLVQQFMPQLKQLQAQHSDWPHISALDLDGFEIEDPTQLQARLSTR